MCLLDESSLCAIPTRYDSTIVVSFFAVDLPGRRSCVCRVGSVLPEAAAIRSYSFLDDSSRRVCEPSKRQVTQMAIDIFCCGSSFEWIGRAEKECSTQPASRKRGTIVFEHRIRHVGYFVV